MIDNLFDSLNSSQFINSNGKQYRCALSADSPHWQLWSEMLPKLSNWKIIDDAGKLSNRFKVAKGWQTTIRAVMLLWRNLREMGLKFLNLRNLNQDPIENIFGQIRQHGIANSNPNCLQFVAALKTLVINNLSSPVSKNFNCEDDFCKSIGNFKDFLQKYSDCSNDLSLSGSDQVCNFNTVDLEIVPNVDEIFPENNYATAYVAGYILKNLNHNNCTKCYNSLHSNDINEEHLFVQFKEHDNETRLIYPSSVLISLVDFIHHKLYKFLDEYGHSDNLEDKFWSIYEPQYKITI